MFSASFQDGVSPTTAYAGTRDTMIDESAPTSTTGSASSLSVDGGSEEKTVLLAWDLEGTVPAPAVIRAATITLTISDKSDDTFDLYAAARAWSEGQATWKKATNLIDWESNGADGVSDRGAAVLGAVRAIATGTYTFNLNAAGIAVLQQWVADPAASRGFILASKSASNRLELRSREYATKTARPKLSLTWELPAPDGGSGSDGGSTPLDPTPGVYKGTCDGSAAIALDGQYFLDANDEDQQLRVYRRGASATAAQAFDVSRAIGLSTSDEADLEGAARVGDRVFITGSHGRDSSGNLDTARYRFFAVDLTGAPPSLGFKVVGSVSHVLSDMLAPANWVVPDTAVIALLQSASQLSKASDPSLAPEVNGTNIEGLGALPTPAFPGQLVFGMRNPAVSGKALLITLRNADAVIAGATAQFGQAIPLDLGGLGVRALAWSTMHQSLLILGGPKGSGGPFRLYRWSGDPAAAPALVQTLTPPPSSSPEAVVPYPSSKDVQVVFDQGDVASGATTCKKASTTNKSFTDVIVHVE